MWNQIILTIISGTLPLLISYGLKVINGYFYAKVKNEQLKNTLEHVSDIIRTVVAETSQVFVHELKKTGEWSREAAEEAFYMSRDRALQIIDSESKKLISGCVGNFDDWLEAKIEQEVSYNH